VKTILFTGFPGFIGMRLLPRLLELHPGTHVACLVQEKFREAAERSLGALQAGHAHARGRIELVAGDITLPGLGVAASRAAELRRSLWQAWHLAAVYDLAVTRVTKGQGGMPSFADKLEAQQIADVAQYVVESTGG